MAAIRSGYPSKRTSVWHEIRKHYVLLLFVLLPLIHIMLFCYKPMYGVILGFAFDILLLSHAGTADCV